MTDILTPRSRKAALLLSKEIPVGTHAGIKSMFGLHFIRTGIIDPELGKFFTDIFNLRHSNDYDDYIYCDQNTFLQNRPKAGTLIAEIQKLLNSQQ